MKRSKKILISGYFGYGNQGDEAILAALSKGLQENLSGVRPVVLSAHPARTKKMHGLEAVNRWRLARVWKELGSSKALITGVGGLYQDVTSNRSLWYYLFIVYMAWLRGIPIFIAGCGIGPIKHRFNRRVTGFILKKARFISVRDEKSVQVLKGWGIEKSRLHQGEDLALGLEFSGLQSMSISDKENQGKKILAVSLRKPVKNNRGFNRTIARAINRMGEEFKIKVLFIPMYYQKDIDLTKETAQNLQVESEIVDSYNMTPYQVMEVIKRCHVLLGMRLHALEFAYLLHIPFLAISYDPKVEEFVEKLNVILPIFKGREIDKEELFLAIRDIMVKNESYRESLRLEVDHLQQSAQSSLEKVCNEISKVL